MKILLAHDWCSLGGHTSWMADVARGMTQAGHEVECFFFEDNDGYLPVFSQHAKATVGDETVLRDLLCRENFDIVHGEACMQDLPHILRRAGCAGRLVITRHSVDAPLGWNSHNCDGYVAITDEFSRIQQACSDLHVPVVANGVDLDAFQRHPGDVPAKRIIGWCARSRDRFKNIQQFVEVTRLLDPELYEFRVADGDKQEGIEEYRQALGAAHITSWRRYRRDELPAFYAAIARSGGCFFHTSRLETLGLVLVEALASECPVIAMRVPGVRDVMRGELSQWLYEETDSNEAVAALIERALPVLHQPEWRARLRRQAAERYSREAMANGYIRVYEEALKHGPMRRPDEAAREVVGNLWEEAARLLAEGGRARDVQFTIEAALALDPASGEAVARREVVAECLRRVRSHIIEESFRGVRTAIQKGQLPRAARLLARSLRTATATPRLRATLSSAGSA